MFIEDPKKVWNLSFSKKKKSPFTENISKCIIQAQVLCGLPNLFLFCTMLFFLSKLHAWLRAWTQDMRSRPELRSRVNWLSHPDAPHTLLKSSLRTYLFKKKKAKLHHLHPEESFIYILKSHSQVFVIWLICSALGYMVGFSLSGSCE